MDGFDAKNHFLSHQDCERYNIGATDMALGDTLRKVFQCRYFKIVVCDDVQTVELCGALKNIVATGAGFMDGLGFGHNSKAAIMRIGMLEMIRFCKAYYPGSKMTTLLESCGVADIITTSYAGRNRRVASEYAKLGGAKSIPELEAELLNGQKLQGAPTAREVRRILTDSGAEAGYPLFMAVARICAGDMQVSEFVGFLEDNCGDLPSISSLASTQMTGC